MYQDNEDDWKILKEYKQKRLYQINKDRENAKKVGNRVNREIPKVKVEVEKLRKELQVSTDENERYQIDEALEKKQDLLEALKDDSKKAESLQAEYLEEQSELKQQIADIDEKIKEIRRKQHEVKSKAKQEEKTEPVQECPKKCRISDVVLSCGHKDHTLEIPPYEDEVPKFHVLSGSGTDTRDIVDITFGGSCDHGKSQNASDSETFKEKARNSSPEQYCPRVNVYNYAMDTDIQRPSKTRFMALTEEFPANSNPIGFLIGKLIFGRDEYDATEYDLSFTSCKGDLPYKATVIAHPACSWNIELAFGYVAKYENFSAERKFAKNKVKQFDGVKCDGKWEAAIKASYKYDSYTTSIEEKLNFEELLKKLKGSWPVLEKLEKFFSPVNGFLESAVGYSKEGEKKFDQTVKTAEKKDKLLSKDKLATVEVKWPNFKIKGGYERVESKNTDEIGGKGTLAVEFDPLIGLTGKLDLVQCFLHWLGGPFGNLLRKASNLSVGKRKDDNSLDESKSYIKSNLALDLGLTGSISGQAAFECTEEKGWHAAESGNGVKGFLGLVLNGYAKVEGKLWVVKVGVNAEFKTTDESGKKNPGFEVEYGPVVIDGEFCWVGKFEFNGLAIVAAFYAEAGVEDAVQSNNEESRATSRNRGPAPKVAVKRELKAKKDQLIFKKRALFEADEVSEIGA